MIEIKLNDLELPSFSTGKDKILSVSADGVTVESLTFQYREHASPIKGNKFKEVG